MAKASAKSATSAVLAGGHCANDGKEVSKFSKDLVQGLKEACEFTEGKREGARVHVIDVPDVRAIRRRLHMSQQKFADAYRIPLATLKNWEQGRRAPDAPAAAYLQAIAHSPLLIREAVQPR
jgi:putative transcriptional regulator